MKGLKKNSILLLLITFVVLFFVVKDDFNAIVDILKNVNPLWVVVGFLTMAASLFFRSLGLREVITGYKFSYSVNLEAQVPPTEWYAKMNCTYP